MWLNEDYQVLLDLDLDLDIPAGHLSWIEFSTAISRLRLADPRDSSRDRPLSHMSIRILRKVEGDEIRKVYI